MNAECFIGRNEKDLTFLLNKKIYLYGAGGVGRITAKYLTDSGIHVESFIDDNIKIGFHETDNISVNFIQNIKFTDDSLILITVSDPYDLHSKALKYCDSKISLFAWQKLNFYNVNTIKQSELKILDMINKLQDDESISTVKMIINHRLHGSKIVPSLNHQYFESDIIDLGENSVFVDGGAYTGDTIKQFISFTKKKYKKIFAFEPNYENYQTLMTLCSDKTDAYNTGLFSSSLIMKVNSDGSGSKISENDGELIQVESLDEFFSNKEEIPTFIKLDIEGSENDAILGMKNILIKYKPTLAISIYHKNHDLWSLPLKILEINPEYKLYIRHYSHSLNETVCYAL